VTVEPLRIFCSYAHEDEPLRKKLDAHLMPLRRSGRVKVWSDRDIVAGTNWDAKIKNELDEADIVLLLVSADFMQSDFCFSKELQRALERYAKREAMVIPVALRAVEWVGTPLEGLQALPRDAKPVTLWTNRDKAWADVARGVREAVEHFAEWRAVVAPQAAPPAAPPEASPVVPAVSQKKAVDPVPKVPAAPPPVQRPMPVLKRVFGEVDFRPIGWFEAGLAAASAIAKIQSNEGLGVGSGFLVDAGDFGLGAEGESLLVTCSYIADDARRNGRGAQPLAFFERLGVRREFGELVWSSPLPELDVHFIRLDAPVDIVPLRLSLRDPGTMDDATPVFVAGHPFAGPLQFSLWRTAWIDYKSPRLHYRASTEAGSGGSAVFDENWRVIALHRAASVHMPRLNGKGKYAACEGMSLRDIRDAIALTQKKGGRRKRRTETLE
jgi:hypothetical protein